MPAVGAGPATPGLPREVGGIPLDEIGATGHGLVAAAEGAVAVPAPNVLMLLVVGLPLLSLGRRVRD